MGNNTFEENRNDFVIRAEEHLRRENPAEALNLAAARLHKYPADAAAIGIYCEALIGLGRIEEMRESLHKVARLIDELNLIHERTGDACREKGLHREAAACYEKFISLRPETERAREVIGKMALLEQEDILSPANDLTDRDNTSEPEFFTVTMAQLYIEQGHVPDAEAVLEKIIKKEPHNSEAMDLLNKIKSPQVSPPAGAEQSPANHHLLKTLSGWLKNIERLKLNAAAKE